MESPSLTWAVFDDFNGQTDDAVMGELIAADEAGGQLGAGIHYRGQFCGNWLLQVAQPVIEKPDADCIRVMLIGWLPNQAEVADVLTAPPFKVFMATVEIVIKWISIGQKCSILLWCVTG